jgi:hypothetical protein
LNACVDFEFNFRKSRIKAIRNCGISKTEKRLKNVWNEFESNNQEFWI